MNSKYFFQLATCLLILFSGCSKKKRFSYELDEKIKPSQKAIAALDGGEPRPICKIMGPDKSTIEFVSDEVVLQPKNKEELAAFLKKYDGKILRDGSPLKIEGMDTVRLSKAPDPSGWYLIHVNVEKSEVNDFVSNMKKQDAPGKYTFSSQEGIKLAAIIAREKKIHAGFNILMKQYQKRNLTENNTLEHPFSPGSYTNTKDFFYMSDKKTQSSGLGIGVIRAWAYLRYKGVPPLNGTWQPPVVAIIDGGFDLDPVTGVPLNDNTDYHFLGGKPLQINMENVSKPVSGIGWEDEWHGQAVFSVVAAYPRNLYGSAGTGGSVVRPLLIQIDGTSYMASEAIRAATYNGAVAINMSFGQKCSNAFCRAFDFSWTDNIQQSINLAASYNVITVSAAGNEQQNNHDQFDNVPCTMENVICVGAILQTTLPETFSGYGRKVSIWAPDSIRTTPDRFSHASNKNPPWAPEELPRYAGTSLASPFVAGIVGLMKALKPGLSYAEVVSILQSTALPSTDAKVVPGYVNALGAVMAIIPNIPPTIQITHPADGDNIVAYTTPFLSCSIADPEQGDGIDGLSVKWVSSIQGELYPRSNFIDGIAGNSLSLLQPGDHILTATVTDPFGGETSHSITIHVNTETPTASITYPPDNSIFFNTQQINLRGLATTVSGIAAPYTYNWTSNIDGALTGGSNDIWVNLTTGIHTIELVITDGVKQSAPAKIKVTVNQASTSMPTAQILAPKDGAGIFAPDEMINFQGIGTDPSDGTLADDKLEWFSDLDGFLGTGKSLMVKLKGGACVGWYHKITLRVTNSGGQQSTHTITISVGKIC